MTYAEKLVESRPFHLERFSKYISYTDAVILINQAMKAQREACYRAYDENCPTEEFSTMMEIAILNAEVKP